MPVQEIVIAVEPQEVAPLAEAMDLKYEITCVARSGRPRPFRCRLSTVGWRSPRSCRLAKAVLAQTARPGQGRSVRKSENRQPPEE